jgi:hypothetical protein
MPAWPRIRADLPGAIAKLACHACSLILSGASWSTL